MKAARWILALVAMIGVFIFLASRWSKWTGKSRDSARFQNTNVAQHHSRRVQNDPEDRFAWEEFISLVHPSDARPDSHPEWVSWANKCDVGLSTACANISARKSSSVLADRAAAEIPRQLLDDFNKMKSKDERGHFLHNYVAAPELASVLYNPRAEDSIRKNHLYETAMLDGFIQQLNLRNTSGADRHLPDGTFRPESQIVKLIWEIIPDADGQELRLYDPEKPPILPKSQRLEDEVDWPARYEIDRYEIDRGKKKPCPALESYGSDDNPKTVPINCFYWFPIKSNPCDSLSKDITIVWGCADAEGQDFLVFLVGFHVMKLTSANPHWIWTTYYWTRKTNKDESGSTWEAPWNHFHQMTTRAIREESSDKHAVCYNPYLEGHEENGLKANCLSCHSFAAYARGVNKVAPGTVHGREYPYLKDKRQIDEQEYFHDAIQTSFVWSIATSQNKQVGKDRKKFQNILGKALRDQLHNQ